MSWPREPAWRMWLGGALTAGVLTAVFAYRATRQSGGGRGRAVLYALSSYAWPLACVALYDLTRRLEHTTPPPHPRRFVPWLSHALVTLAVAFSPASDFVLVLLVAQPVGFAVLQLAATRRVPSEAAPVSRTARLVVLASLLLGALATAACVVWVDLPTLKLRLAPRAPVSAPLRSPSGRFALSAPAEGWRIVAPGTHGDADAELELVGQNSDTWAVAYVFDDGDVGSRVRARRDLIFGSEVPVSFLERRFFLDDADLVPASLARYRVASSWSQSLYFVLTAATEKQVFEVVGYTAAPDERSAELETLVMSLHLEEPAP